MRRDPARGQSRRSRTPAGGHRRAIRPILARVAPRGNLFAWLHPWSRARASPPPGPRTWAQLARSSSRASSRASASGRSSGAWRPSSASPAVSATRPGGWRSRPRGSPAALDAFVRRLRSDAPPRARVDGVSRPRSSPAGAAALARPFSDRRERRRGGHGATLPAGHRHLRRLPARGASTRPTGATATRSRTAPTAARGPRSSTSCRTTAPGPRCGPSRSARPAPRSTPTRRTAASTPSRWRARPADRAWPTGRPAPPPRAPATTTRWRPRPPTSWPGRIVAVKGLGGYHLACDATDATAVGRLRDRKRRWAKPFAVMVADLAAAERLARVGATERRLLAGPERPIVLLVARRRGEPRLAPSVAAGNHRLGVFLPYTPLHHLLLAAVGRPIVLTSGNLSDEPLATDDADAAERLAGLADAFLVHDREIRARYDDSVSRVVAGRASIVRRGRGYAPEALPLPVAGGAADPGGRGGAEAHLHAGPRAGAPTWPRTTATWRTCRRTGRSPTAWPTCPGCSRSSRRSWPTTSTRSTSRRSTPWPGTRRGGGSRSSTTTPTWRRARPSTASPGRSSASPTTASAWATTARCGAARSSPPTWSATGGSAASGGPRCPAAPSP